MAAAYLARRGEGQLNITIARPEDIKALTDISKSAFDTDVLVGGAELGGPPDYDSEKWHTKMMKNNYLYTITQGDSIIGGAILIPDDSDKTVMYVGRVFIDPKEHKKGFGLEAMNFIEEMFSDIKTWRLETPVWNIRTNSFYKKLGYLEMHRDSESVYYQKEI